MGEGAFPGVHSPVAKLPLLGALPSSLAEDKPLGPAPSPCAQGQHRSGLWGSALGAAGWNEWPVEAKKALSDPSFGKASGFPPSCSPHTPIPHSSTPPSLLACCASLLPFPGLLCILCRALLCHSPTASPPRAAPAPPLPSKPSPVLPHPALLSRHCAVPPSDASGRHRRTKPGWGRMPWCCRGRGRPLHPLGMLPHSRAPEAQKCILAGGEIRNPECPLCTLRSEPVSPPHKIWEKRWAKFPPKMDLCLPGGTSLSHQHVLGIRPWGRVFPQSQLFRNSALPRSGLMAQNPLLSGPASEGTMLEKGFSARSRQWEKQNKSP